MSTWRVFYERHRCQIGLHRWREVPHVWWSLAPPGYECEICHKRFYLDC